MDKKAIRIMLVDDNPDDNFIHERVIKKNIPDAQVMVMCSAEEALAHLKSLDSNQSHPDLIFLDINMPGMDGWEFLEEYKKLDKEYQGSGIVVMLTKQEEPGDAVRTNMSGLAYDFKTKPLTQEMLQSVLDKFLLK